MEDITGISFYPKEFSEGHHKIVSMETGLNVRWLNVIQIKSPMTGDHLKAIFVMISPMMLMVEPLITVKPSRSGGIES